jgi:hypothetical protein
MMDQWRPIPEWEGIYEVSRDGLIRSVARTIHKPDGTEQRFNTAPLSAHNNSKGYLVVRLSDSSNGRRGMFRVHRLVASAFLEPPALGMEINHKDGNKANASASNLEWVTSKENKLHARDNGLMKYAKVDLQVAAEIRASVHRGEAKRALARAYGLSPKTIRRIVSGECWLPSPPAGETP